MFIHVVCNGQNNSVIDWYLSQGPLSAKSLYDTFNNSTYSPGDYFQSHNLEDLETEMAGRLETLLKLCNDETEFNLMLEETILCLLTVGTKLGNTPRILRKQSA